MTERLSALDASFLYLESPRTPMHVGSVSVFDGRVRIDELQAVTLERMQLVPRFRKRVVAPPLRLGLPYWVDDADFDVRHHVRLASLPGPGSPGQLRELTSQLHMELLDRSRPLWEIWLVDGLADGRVAVVEKMHHALVDGVSGVDVAMATLDIGPEVAHPGPWTWQPEGRPSLLGLVKDAAVDAITRPAAALARRARDPRRLARDTARLVRGLRASPPNELLAPRCSLNQPIGASRMLDTVSLPLADVKAVGRAAGTKANDVLLACVAGGLRRLFEERGEAVDGLRPHALVPVSLRTEDQRLGLGNQVSAMIVPLPVDVADPGDRLRAVMSTTKRLKENDAAAVSAALLGAVDSWPLPAVLPTLVAPLVHRQPLVNVVVTNVPGPPVPLFMLGAPMVESTPVVPLARNLDVSIGILSYLGEIRFGLFADTKTCPDVHVLAEGIEKSFFELEGEAS